jgi:hypothetical protein
MFKSSGLLSAVALILTLMLASTSANAMGDKQWAGLYGGFTSAFIGAAGPEDNFYGGLKKKAGGSAGINVGWNYVSEEFLFGFEGDTQVASMILRHSDGYMKRSVDITSISTLRARAGMIFGEERDYLAYVTGGVAFTGVETDIRGFKGRSYQDDKVVTGFAVGGGLEMWLFGNDWITTTFEYLYTNVPGKNYNSGYGYSADTQKSDSISIEEMSSYRFKTGIHHIRGAWNLHF